MTKNTPPPRSPSEVTRRAFMKTSAEKFRICITIIVYKIPTVIIINVSISIIINSVTRNFIGIFPNTITKIRV